MTDEGKICADSNIQNRHPVGAGHAPPATVCYNEYYGYSVGAAYMPPVAATRQCNLTAKSHGTVKTVPYNLPETGVFPYNRLRPGYL